MALAIVLVVLALVVVGGVLVVTYKMINRLPRDGESGNGEGDAG